MNGKDTIGQATGFFIKRCGKLYLVSCYHVLAFRNTDKTPILDSSNNQRYSDNFILRYNQKPNGKWSYLRIKRAPIIKNTDSLDFPYGYDSFPDVWAVYIPQLSFKEVNVLDIDNNILKFPKSNNEVVYGFYFGFTRFTKSRDRDPDKWKTQFFGDSFLLTENPNDPNFSVAIKTAGFYGASGSPIFIIYKDNGKPVIRFAGVFYGTKTLNSDENSKNVDLSMGVRCDVLESILASCYD